MHFTNGPHVVLVLVEAKLSNRSTINHDNAHVGRYMALVASAYT